MTEPLDLDKLERRREYALAQWHEGDNDLVYDFVRDDVLTLLDRLRAAEARVAALRADKLDGDIARTEIEREHSGLAARVVALEAAARKAIERFVLIPNSDAPVCMYCDTFVWPHAEDCPIGVLEALLDGDA
jgi:hypothetical protein